jgi:hypothetical protein
MCGKGVGVPHDVVRLSFGTNSGLLKTALTRFVSTSTKIEGIGTGSVSFSLRRRSVDWWSRWMVRIQGYEVNILLRRTLKRERWCDYYYYDYTRVE